MRTGHGGQRAGRSFASIVGAVLVAGSICVAAPAQASQSGPNGGQSAQGRAHSAKHQGDSGRAHAHQRPTTVGASGDHGTSGVSLPKPNDFQAQADPDGAENGGVDQPGGTGGLDPTAQDGNNGSGNDADCEDDNQGVGVPGHCKPGPEPVVTPPADEGTSPVGGDDQEPVVEPVVVPVLVPAAPDQPETALPVVSPPTATSTTVSQARGETGATVLPNTGAGAALFGLALAAVAALLVGAGLTHQGRRTARVSG